jgi:hypothetical protein
MTNHLRWPAAVALLAAATACGERTDKDVQTAANTSDTTISSPGTVASASGRSLIRVVNAIRNGKSIQLKGDDSTLFDNVNSGSVTPYREVSDNVVKFQLVHPGDSTGVIADNRETMRDGVRYTVIAMPGEKGKDPIVSVIRDDLTPEPGKARIRVIHAAPNVGEVDVVMPGETEPIFKGLNFHSEAGFKDVAPGTTTLSVRPKGKTTELLRVRDLRLIAGSSQTLVLTRLSSGKLGELRFEDKLVGDSTAARDSTKK